MRTVPLGRSGLNVSRLGFGCMGLAEFYGAPLSNRQAEAVLDAALARGINFFDTADMYGSGRNEEQLSGFLKRRRDEVVLATKFAVRRGPNGEWLGLSNDPKYIRQACEASLKRLGVEVIDLYYMHRRDRSVPVEDSVGAMAELVKQGKARAIGLSEVSVETLRKANAVHPIAAVQSEYSIVTREMEKAVIPACRELGVAFVAYSPLGRGLLTGAYRSEKDFSQGDYRMQANPRFAGGALEKNLKLVDRIAEIAKQKGASPAQIALAWVLAKGEDIIPIPGTKKVERLEENLGALAVTLSDEDVAAIERAAPPDAVVGARYPETSASSLDG
ncbi:aldo/keto reductase [Amphiplicatus metriothermophilus]|uniref:Predicted oxidoreductase n=1 Tax=Amphiplicatus metriothermophilus TaxID=1519374 RepID=A0A239PJL4_9PROT|nr:aldo/keto reductase [Amphiplicatus metriothermophilus]MBB5518153.1 aryl-alcohol dehydrogenase-like predicted oxidoreductase [Amphiplicatus metriothermophilus]SNT67513.1 Predicted oxidoreductase [Amphiplicatus metriothermophilus]